jgi:hypothetical protein
MHLGASAYLVKPFPPETLIELAKQSWRLGPTSRRMMVAPVKKH